MQKNIRKILFYFKSNALCIYVLVCICALFLYGRINECYKVKPNNAARIILFDCILHSARALQKTQNEYLKKYFHQNLYVIENRRRQHNIGAQTLQTQTPAADEASTSTAQPNSSQRPSASGSHHPSNLWTSFRRRFRGLELFFVDMHISSPR